MLSKLETLSLYRNSTLWYAKDILIVKIMNSEYTILTGYRLEDANIRQKNKKFSLREQKFFPRKMDDFNKKSILRLHKAKK